MMIVVSQCGNYGNLLSRYFDKNFVKAISTKEVTKELISRDIFSVRVNISFLHTLDFESLCKTQNELGCQFKTVCQNFSSILVRPSYLLRHSRGMRMKIPA